MPTPEKIIRQMCDVFESLGTYVLVSKDYTQAALKAYELKNLCEKLQQEIQTDIINSEIKEI